MKTLLCNFVKDEQGQDLIEYTLLLAFVCSGFCRAVHQRRRQRGRYLERHQLETGCGQHVRQLVILGGAWTTCLHIAANRSRLKTMWNRFLNDEQGQDLIEYTVLPLLLGFGRALHQCRRQCGRHLDRDQ